MSVVQKLFEGGDKIAIVAKAQAGSHWAESRSQESETGSLWCKRHSQSLRAAPKFLKVLTAGGYGFVIHILPISWFEMYQVKGHSSCVNVLSCEAQSLNGCCVV